MKQKQKNDPAILGEKRVVFIIRMPEIGSNNISPEEALRTLSEVLKNDFNPKKNKEKIVQAIDVLTQESSLKQYATDLEGFKDRLDELTDNDKIKLRRILEALAENKELLSGNAQLVYDVIIKHEEAFSGTKSDALIADEKEALKKWSTGEQTLSKQETRHVISVLRRMIGTNGLDGQGRQIMKTASLQEAAKIHSAILTSMHFLQMDSSQYRREMEKDEVWEGKSSESIQNITDAVSAETLSIQSEQLRKMVNISKEKFLLNATKGALGLDNQLLPMLSVVINGGVASSPQQKQKAMQMILKITTDGQHTYSPRDIQKKISEWDGYIGRSHGQDKPGNVEKFVNKINTQPALLQYAKQAALYELAMKAKEEMLSAGGTTEQDFKSLNVDQSTGGYRIMGQQLGFSEEDFEDAGNMAKKILSPTGLATFYVMQYGGFLMALLNFVSFVQSKGQNGQALAYAAAGVAAMKGGEEITRRGTIKSILHPENYLFNQVSSLATEHEIGIIKEFQDNIEFYKQLNINDKKKGRDILSRHKKEKKDRFDKAVRERDKERIRQGYHVTKTEFVNEAHVHDFLSDGTLYGLLVNNPDMGTIKNQKDTDNIPEIRYKAIEFLLDRKIEHADLDSIYHYASNMDADRSVAEKVTLGN